MECNVNIPDKLIVLAEIAAGNINARQPAARRTDEKLKLDKDQVRDIVINHLISLVITDDNEQAALDADVNQQKQMVKLEKLR